MVSYSEFSAALVQSVREQENALPLRNEHCRTRLFLQPAPAPKVCLFFHGFTAAPYQFQPMGEALFREGYTVLVPRMPGHAKLGNWERDNPPPLPTEAKDYQIYALKWYQVAKALGKEVVIGGISGGGTLAAWLAYQFPQEIDRALLFAPYLSSSNKVIDLFIRHFDTYFEWVNTDPDESKRLAYSGFSMPALRVFLLMGQAILEKARKNPAPPLFVISSESDVAVGNRDHRELFEDALKRQPKCWYHRFARVLDIPHTMMTVEEGNRYASLLVAMSKAFIQSDLTWAEVEEIGYRMTKGKTFDTVVGELGLRQKVSRDMPAMMTMVDKREIALKRNRSFVR